MVSASGSTPDSGSFSVSANDTVEVIHYAGIKGTICITANATIQEPYLGSVVAFDTVTGAGLPASAGWVISTQSVGLYAGITPS